jgi:hypothetical protein
LSCSEQAATEPCHVIPLAGHASALLFALGAKLCRATDRTPHWRVRHSSSAERTSMPRSLSSEGVRRPGGLQLRCRRRGVPTAWHAEHKDCQSMMVDVRSTPPLDAWCSAVRSPWSMMVRSPLAPSTTTRRPQPSRHSNSRPAGLAVHSIRCVLAIRHDNTARPHAQSHPAWHSSWEVSHTWCGNSTGPIPATARWRASRSNASAA